MSFVIPSIFSAIDGLTAPVRTMMRTMSAFSAASETAGVKANRAFNKIGTGADRAFNALNPLNKINGALAFTGVTIGAAGAATALGKFITEASKIEDATASFQALLGGVENAKKLVGDLYKLGAETPFDFNALSSAANVMIGFGAATQANVIDKLKMMGDAAKGNVEYLGGITLAFSQIEAAGKASMQDVNQLINNGVPILGQLAKQWKMTTGAAREAVSKGKASSAEITKAFEAMTSKGGMFYNGMAIASQTFSGKLSTLKDTINQTFASIGTVALPVVKEYIDKATSAAGGVQAWAAQNQELIKGKVASFVEGVSKAIKFLITNYEKIVLGVKIYVGALILLKAASIASTVATVASTVAQVAYNVVMGISIALQGKSAFFVMGNAVAYGAYRAAVVTATAVQWLWNAALTANPIGLVIVGIAALIALIVVIVKKWETWGAALAVFLGPLGLVISMVMSFRKNWDLVVKAFKTDGILGGLKAIGKVMLDSVLYPIERILAIAGSIPGKVGEWARAGADKIADFRSAMGTGVNKPSDNAVQNPFGSQLYPAINPKQAQAQMLEQTINKNTTNKQQVSIDINDKSGKASVTKNTGGVPLVMTSTMGFGK